ncbi:MAG: hypothetical protein WA210_10595 [Burkholderiaceae bacterium]
MPLNHSSEFAALTDEQHAAIGRVVVEWSNVEYMLSVLLSRLLRTPEYLGRTYSAGLSAVRVQAAISEAVEIHRHRYGHKIIAEEVLVRIESSNHRVTSLRAERNKISHFCWCRTDDESVFGTNFAGGVPSEKWERKNLRQVSLADLRKLYTEAHSLTEELMLIANSIKPIDEAAA